MKFKKLWKALGLIVKKPYLLNEVLQNEERFKENVRSKYSIESGLPVIDFLDIANQALKADPYAFLDGGSLPTDIILLKSITQQFESAKYFEIGTWRGESVANVAQIADQCYTLNQSEDEMRAMGLSEDIIRQLRFYSHNLTNVTHLKGNSYSFDYSVYHQKMDVVFIDGDHTYEGVKNDTAKALPLLKDDSSIIVWHDYAHNPDSVRWEVLQGILDGIPKEQHKFLFAVSNTKCAIFTKKPYNTKKPQSPSTPDKNFEVSVQCTPLKN